MKLKIVLFGLCLSYALMAIAFSGNPTGSCSDSTYTFTLTGTTDASVSSGSATVTLSSPNGVTPTCTVPDVVVGGGGGGGARLRNLEEELIVTCTISTELTGATITVKQVTIGGGVSSADDLGLSVAGSVTCPAATPVTPVTIGTSKLKVSSVSGTSVVVAITLDTPADAEKVLTAAATITNLNLVDSSAFNQALTCTIAAGTIPSTVTCTMGTAATAGTKYKLSGSAAFASSGSDQFGAVTVQADEVTAVAPITIGTSKLKVSSVSQKNVVVAITLDTAGDASKVLTADATINDLNLVDNASFSQALTCNIASGSTLSSVTCTMGTAATAGTKYKLSGTASIVSKGADKFGAVTVQTDEVTATDPPSGGDNTPTSISSWITNSVMLFIFTLLF